MSVFPAGADPNEPSYEVSTWNTCGIVTQSSLVADHKRGVGEKPDHPATATIADTIAVAVPQPGSLAYTGADAHSYARPFTGFD